MCIDAAVLMEPQDNPWPLPLSRVEILLGFEWTAGEVTLTLTVQLDLGPVIQVDWTNINHWRYEADIAPTIESFSDSTNSPSAYQHNTITSSDSE